MAELRIGYARVSTVDQDLTAQRDALTALGVDPKRIYVDHGLTGTNRDRPGLRQALAACRSGDTLVVTKLDRLARSVPDARDIVDELTANGVKLNIGGSVHDPTDPVGRLLFTTLTMIAEFEADLARARTREGMGRPGQGPAAWQATQTQSAAGSAPRRALPRRRTHHRRARGAVSGDPLNDLPGRRACGRASVRDIRTEHNAMTDLVGRTTRGIFRDLMIAGPCPVPSPRLRSSLCFGRLFDAFEQQYVVSGDDAHCEAVLVVQAPDRVCPCRESPFRFSEPGLRPSPGPAGRLRRR